MSLAPPASLPPLNARPVADLQACCAQEQARYRRSPDCQESSCCLEIVRRAATGQDDHAFDVLLEVARPIVRTACPRALRAACDDLEAEVAARLFKRLYRGEQPFQASNFGAFINYLKVTAKSAAIVLLKARSSDESLDALRLTSGYEPPAPGPEELIERRMRFARFLELLPTQAHRDAFYHRFALGQDSAEAAVALGLSKRELYRLVEQAIRILAAHPEVRELLEA